MNRAYDDGSSEALAWMQALTSSILRQATVVKQRFRLVCQSGTVSKGTSLLHLIS
jgi:hypothetical protein